ncbi:kif1-binding protein [Holotrichia oblita]|uniref:Kif1-binding protein n=3 Tax=Holotrichia oblita TaxID=644536 RepID=A0ACB9T8K5_HOLOL|nr:kif1-binding protein [Holotrichia oblita]KAI4463095.1 kif1-binding protein [Holotrichia oblita]KAI4463138.1 kif1-binding protein [Holotrichia oblita]
MIISKEALVDLQEKYEKVKKLIEEDSKLDPETEPFLSKYAARTILISMNANLENLLRQQGEDSTERIKLLGMNSMIQLLLGIVSIDTEELSVGEKHLTKCKAIIDKNENVPEIAYVTLNMHNQLGILWSKREPKKAQTYLEEADKFYLSFKESGQIPIDPNELFIHNLETYNTVSAWEKFEKLYTLTLYYLAQIHGVLGDSLKSSVYCHITLKRQLESDDYDAIDWALNCATLSQFFMEVNGFKQARHHLAASSYIINKYEEELNNITECNENYNAKIENFRHRSADIARCWAKYGLLLMYNSKERLLKHTEDIDSQCTEITDLSKLTLKEDSTVKIEDLKQLFFPSLDLKSYEENITDQFLLTFDDAKKVFLNIQRWLNKAQEYYTLETLASDYIEIIQDQSQAYDSLVFYEENPDNQAKLYKRSVDLLENVISQVNPTYYMQYCRQIWFRLGQTYSDMINIKCDKLKESNSRPTPHTLNKINGLIEKSIHNFTSFIESFRNPKKELPKKIDDDFQKSFLQAYFHIGALHGRYITLDKTKQLENCEASLNAYHQVDVYCKENPKAAELIPSELGIVKEMLQLLPMKAMKLQHEL